MCIRDSEDHYYSPSEYKSKSDDFKARLKVLHEARDGCQAAASITELAELKMQISELKTKVVNIEKDSGTKSNQSNPALSREKT